MTCRLAVNNAVSLMEFTVPIGKHTAHMGSSGIRFLPHRQEHPGLRAEARTGSQSVDSDTAPPSRLNQ